MNETVVILLVLLAAVTIVDLASAQWGANARPGDRNGPDWSAASPRRDRPAARRSRIVTTRTKEDLVDATRFDRLVSSLAKRTPRRSALRALVGGGSGAVLAHVGLGLAAARPPHGAAAEKERRQTPKRNALNCVDVGDACANGGQCCSGICRGEPGKRTCRAHDSSTCGSGQHDPDCGGAASIPCTSASGQPGVCQTTTGTAGYCAVTQSCHPCRKDVDCRPQWGPNAACLRCQPDCAPTGGTACATIVAS